MSFSTNDVSFLVVRMKVWDVVLFQNKMTITFPMNSFLTIFNETNVLVDVGSLRKPTESTGAFVWRNRWCLLRRCCLCRRSDGCSRSRIHVRKQQLRYLALLCFHCLRKDLGPACLVYHKGTGKVCVASVASMVLQQR